MIFGVSFNFGTVTAYSDFSINPRTHVGCDGVRPTRPNHPVCFNLVKTEQTVTAKTAMLLQF